MAKGNKYKAYVLAWLFLTVIIISHFLKIIQPVESALAGLAISLFSPFYKFKTANTADSVASTTCGVSTTPEIAYLQSKAQLLTDENTELKKQLNYIKANKLNAIAAEVVGKDTVRPDQIYIINRGSNDNIKVGDSVIVGEGILAGKINKVRLNYSFMRLITDNQSRVASTLLNKDRSNGVVEGGFGLSLKMIYISRNETVMIGDAVITSGLQNGLPRGLLIGNVIAIENEAYQPFQQAILSPAAELSKLRNVSVLSSFGDNLNL